MSRVGRLPIPVSSGVVVEWKNNHIIVSGPKGKLERDLYPGMELEISKDQIIVRPPQSRDPLFRGLYGLTRTLVYNMVQGVTEGFEKQLEVQGVGYRAQVENNKLTLQVGYSHPVEYQPPEGITLETPKPTQIKVRGINKELVGATAAELRRIRKPEPYKGKGVRLTGEKIRLKAGKTGASAKK
ncbi:50S ribosomal protein L6 [bacterium]|nr:50S ribosomal protein L6 [bacterium]